MIDQEAEIPRENKELRKAKILKKAKENQKNLTNKENWTLLIIFHWLKSNLRWKDDGWLKKISISGSMSEILEPDITKDKSFGTKAMKTFYGEKARLFLP